jgi:hypothetical protein
MDKKSKGIANIVGIIPRVVTVDKRNYLIDDDAESRASDEEFAIAASFESKNRYYPIDKKIIRILEIEQQIHSSPPWFLALQRTIGDLTARVTELQVRGREEPTQPIKLYNATIYDLDNVEFDLTIPIQVVIEEYSDETLARIPELNIFTSSDTDTESIFLLKQEIVDLYKELGHCNNLGPLPRSWLNTLNKLLRKRN